MGGGKSVTVDNVQAVPIINTTDNLFNKQLLRYYGLTRSIEPVGITKHLINNINFFFNNKIFERLGVAVQGQLSSSTITDYTVESSLPTGSTLLYYRTNDLNSKVITGETEQIKNFLDTNYIYDNTYIVTISETYYLHNDNTNTDENISVTQDVYKYKLNTDYYNFDSYTVNVDGSYHIKLINESNATDIVYLDTPVDTNIYYIIEYSNAGSYYFMTKSKSEILEETTARESFVWGIKKGGVDISTSQYKKVLKMKFGLNATKDGDSFESNIISNADIKDAFISYTRKYNDSTYANQIKTIYGDINNPISVTYTGSDFIVSYDYIKSSLNINFISTINGTQLDDNKWASGTISVILPFDLQQKKTIQERYNALKELLTLIVHAQKTVHKKWYQTGFFGFLVTIATAGFAIMTGQFETFALLTGASLVVNALVKNPLLKLILNIGFILIAHNFKGGSFKLSNLSRLDWIKFAFKLTTNLFKVHYQKLTQKTYQQISNMNKQIDEYGTMIQNIKKQAIYMPFELQDFYYNAMYELPYKQFELLSLSTQPNNQIYNQFG